MIWFTSDTHFDHKNILKYHGSTRPFKSVDEMNEVLVANWNSVVQAGDTVYHLGDFAFKGHAHFRGLLNGDIQLLEGSHDRMSLKDQRAFVWNGPLFVLKGEPDIILCHYAMRVWPRSHYGTWHLFGHSHGHLPPHGKSFDVGVDAWGLTPISMNRVKDKMDALEIWGGVDSRYTKKEDI